MDHYMQFTVLLDFYGRFINLLWKKTIRRHLYLTGVWELLEVVMSYIRILVSYLQILAIDYEFAMRKES